MSSSPPTPDTARSAYRALEVRATIGITGLLAALAAVAWWVTVGHARDMAGMAQGLAQVGVAMPFDMAAPLFLGMWATMVAAMMLPTVAPIVLLHRMVMRRQARGPGSTVGFAAGYLLAWTAAGVVPLLALLAFRDVASQSPWLARVGGGVLVLAGLYQFTAWKAACLRACQQPLTFLLTHRFGQGRLGAVRTGVSHGLYCLGCCWALMTVLFVVGLMNLVWMAAVAVVFLAEKHWVHGAALARVVGTAVVLLGLAVLVEPALLGTVSGGSAGGDGMQAG